MTKKTLGLVMIVKNEEKGLARCIDSVRDIVDEIIIAVDADSTDNTLEIAKKYTENIKIFQWNDSFAEARNYAQEGAKSDWLLFLDGHEYVLEHANLEKMLESDVEGLMTTVEMENGARFRNPRIYRNGIKFVGDIHEKQDMTNVIPYIEFVIKHDRALGQSAEAALERAKQRDDMVPRIMGAMYKRDKKNTRASFHLALYSQGTGKMVKAIKWYKRYLKYSKDIGERWFAYFNIAICHLSYRNFTRVMRFADLADKEEPGRWETDRLRAFVYFEKGLYSMAIEYFVKSMEDDKQARHYRPWKRKIDDVWNSIGECFFRMGNIDSAAEAFGRASEVTDDEKFKKFTRARCELMVNILRDEHKKLRGFTDLVEPIDKDCDI